MTNKAILNGRGGVVFFDLKHDSVLKFELSYSVPDVRKTSTTSMYVRVQLLPDPLTSPPTFGDLLENVNGAEYPYLVSTATAPLVTPTLDAADAAASVASVQVPNSNAQVPADSLRIRGNNLIWGNFFYEQLWKPICSMQSVNVIYKQVVFTIYNDITWTDGVGEQGNASYQLAIDSKEKFLCGTGLSGLSNGTTVPNAASLAFSCVLKGSNGSVETGRLVVGGPCFETIKDVRDSQATDIVLDILEKGSSYSGERTASANIRYPHISLRPVCCIKNTFKEIIGARIEGFSLLGSGSKKAGTLLEKQFRN